MCLGAAREERGRGSSSPKRDQKKPRVPSAATRLTDCTVRRQPSRHSRVDRLVSALNYGNCSVSVYLSVDFVNRQFVTWRAAY